MQFNPFALLHCDIPREAIPFLHGIRTGSNVLQHLNRFLRLVPNCRFPTTLTKIPVIPELYCTLLCYAT